METYLSFGVWTRGLKRKTRRSFLALSLREKSAKCAEISDLLGPVKNERKRVSWMFALRKVKEEVRWSLVIVWPTKSRSLGLSTYMKLWHYVLNSHWLHVGEISTILSHASYLIKTTTMYLIIKPFNIVLYILSIYT